ncbi:MAG: hypothetical protein ABJE66_26970 [Deltaproteobacteria bacterium]
MNERETREPQPVSPVRDESALGPGEDLDRKPGGFPHAMIAATAGFAIVLAGLVLFALIDRSVAALIFCALLIPVTILLLRRESSRERNSIHPSR